MLINEGKSMSLVRGGAGSDPVTTPVHQFTSSNNGHRVSCTLSTNLKNCVHGKPVRVCLYGCTCKSVPVWMYL